MNSKVSFFNYNYLKENMKKSRGIIFLFILIIPVFTYLFMLLINNAHEGTMYFPSLSDISIPALIGMYIVPFITAIALFNYLFKKDSVDFINALPLKRQTIYLTNIIGGIGIFFVIFLITSLLMLLTGNFFSYLVIPKMMYWHFFITFFITYSFTFIVSALTLSLTGSRVAHVALTLILLFIPGFVSDFYSSQVYGNKLNNYAYPTCDKYDEACDNYEIFNQFKVEQSYKLESGQTLPYKYVSIVPRAIFSMSTNEVMYQNELSSVYNVSSLIRMIFLSIVYLVLGLYVFNNRKMEVAESTFKNENAHQIVKCITLFPLCLGTISILVDSKELIALWIMLAITITIYAVYDLITRRNSGQYVKSIIYFLGLVLSSIIIYITFAQIGNLEASKVIEKDDVANVGIVPNVYLGDGNNVDFNLLKYKLTNSDIINLIFDSANKRMTGNTTSNLFALRLGLKNGTSYYFNMRLLDENYDKLLEMLDDEKDYITILKDIPYNKIYGVRLGDRYLNEEMSQPIIDLIKEGYKDKNVSDIVNATYLDYQEGYNARYSLVNRLYVYDVGIKTYSVSTMINPKLINYVMQTYNTAYMENIKDKNININQLSISLISDSNDEETSSFFKYIYANQDEVYRYINDNIKNDIDFSKYDEEDLVYFSIYANTGTFTSNSYDVFLPKDAAFEEFFNNVKKYINTHPDAVPFGKI